MFFRDFVTHRGWRIKKYRPKWAGILCFWDAKPDYQLHIFSKSSM